MDIKSFENYEIKKHTTFKIGGKANRVFFPKNVEEFLYLLDELKNPIILGGCSNVLVSSLGIENDVILTTDMKSFDFQENKVNAECGVKVPLLSREAQKRGLSGFEFMIGFPGTIGGAVYMNASAHNQSVSDTFLSAKIFDMSEKKVLDLNKEDLKFSYRKSILGQNNYILLSAEFELKEENPEKINTIMERNIEFRKNRQPSLSLPNAGSIFKNPEGDSAGRLLENAGAKEFAVGGAKVWENHANFIVNTLGADSKDVSLLMNKMYNSVKEKYRIELQPEIKFVGLKSKEEETIWDTMLKR